MMASLAASLLVVALCFHLPFDIPPDSVGWYLAPHLEQPMLELVDIRQKVPDKGHGAPVTGIDLHDEMRSVADDDTSEENAGAEESTQLPSPAVRTPLQKLKLTPALEFAERMPNIAGGLGSYYIHIDYPREAIEKGIEGRLILVFTVEHDGSASEISVLQSLHPLCDSAAVQALRKTRFVPGRQDDEVVRVRMRLPVRFRLIQPSEQDSTLAKETGVL